MVHNSLNYFVHTVNDLGGGRDGTGKSFAAADSVVKEIQERGGQAVADYSKFPKRNSIDSSINNMVLIFRFGGRRRKNCTNCNR